MENIFWRGYCNYDRNSAISKIEEIVNEHGYIIDFMPFSDLSISIIIEVQEYNLDKLYSALYSYLKMDSFEELNSPSTTERLVFLNITFIKGTGNLRIEIPDVPG